MPVVSNEAGMTLPELLIAMVISLLVLFAAARVIEGSSSISNDARARVDATQRGRAALEEVVRTLRSRRCIAVSPSATSTSITMDVDFSDGSGAVTRRTIAFDAGSKRLTETRGTTTRTIANDVEAVAGTPVFQFFDIVGGTTPMAVPLTATSVSQVGHVLVTFALRPARRASGPKPVVMRGDARQPAIDITEAVPACT